KFERRFALLPPKGKAGGEVRERDWLDRPELQQRPSPDHWHRSKVQVPHSELASPARHRLAFWRKSPIGADAGIRKSKGRSFLQPRSPFRCPADFDLLLLPDSPPGVFGRWE